MLGLRRFKNVQIDIWQGDILKFASDAIASFERGAAAMTLLQQNPEDANAVFTVRAVITNSAELKLAELSHVYEQIIQLCDRERLRHLVIPAAYFSQSGSEIVVANPKTALEALKYQLQTKDPLVLARVTFVADHFSMYDSLQRYLFAEFEDEIDDEGY